MATFQLTPEQQRTLDNSMSSPVRAVDPRTNVGYVLVREDDYQRLQELHGREFHPSEAYAAIDRAFAEGWDDPKMDDYDRYEELKR